MISALGHCEDQACMESSSTSQKIVRLFRCSIHCDRHLCLHHLNAHNVYYEQEKKQNDAVLTELRNSFSIYQSLFEQQIIEYRELVHQATSLLLHNTSTLLPIEQIRPVLEKVQRAIVALKKDKVAIKCEPVLNTVEIDIENIESNPLKDYQTIKKEDNSQSFSDGVAQAVVVRLQRVEFDNKGIQNENRSQDQIRNSNGSCAMGKLLCLRAIESDSEVTIKANSSHHVQMMPNAARSRKSTDDGPRDAQQSDRSSQDTSPAFCTKKKFEKIIKTGDKTIPLKRLQT